MESPAPPSSAAAAIPAATATSPPTRLRLMCSYGGHIIPRPHTKSLYYAGGDTRIITLPPAPAAANSLSLSSLISHLAATLHIAGPFAVKYQLPSHDLDSLISLSTDEDLLIMLEEYQRLSPTPSRIRLFIFEAAAKPISPLLPEPKAPSGLQFFGGGSELKHPKTETWFSDALKSAKIMQKECTEGNMGMGGVASDGGVLGISGAESIVLETSSSFGSTSSSVSLTNLPSKGPGLEDDTKSKLPALDSVSSDNGAATAVSHPQSGGFNQDLFTPVSTTENIVSRNLFESSSSESKVSNPVTGSDLQNPVQVSWFPLSVQYDQPQKVQFLHTGAPHYVPPNPTGVMQMPSYYLVNSPVPQQQLYYQTNQPQPMYFVPVGQPYNYPLQSGLVSTAPVASSRPPVHPNSLNTPQGGYKVAPSPVPELAPQVYRTVPMASALVNVPHSETHRQAGGLPQMGHQAQPIAVASVDAGNGSNELDDDLARMQIYKSQPPPPALPSQYQTMTQATTVMLSDALAQLHTDNFKQQLGTSQPQ